MKGVWRLLGGCVFAAGLCLSVPGAHAYEVHDGPTGVLKHTKGKAYEGYTLFAPTSECKTTYLINMEGDVVHKWESEYSPALFAYLLPNGNLLRPAKLPDAPTSIGGVGGLVQEIDWDGKVVWEYRMANDNEVQHHLAERMPNGNTLILGWERVDGDTMIKKGRKPGSFPTEPIKLYGGMFKDFWVDFVREVDKDGKTVWEWHAIDHLGTGPNKLDINFTLPKKVGLAYATFDWSHFNTATYLPETDQVLLCSRNMSEIYIIDKKTGNIVFRWGNPAAYGKGERPGWFDDKDQQIFGPHHASLLPNGNLQIFDNGSERPEGNRSRVIEVDMKTGKIVWEYAANGYNSFWSYRQGAAQYLPNGNRLITASNQGHVFEVTPEGEVVWEFVNPIIFGKSEPMFRDKEHKYMGKNFFGNMIHRAYRYDKDHPALKGKKLKPQGHIVEGYPKFLDVWKPLPKK